jgi:hypothetical protein
MDQQEILLHLPANSGDVGRLLRFADIREIRGYLLCCAHVTLAQLHSIV